MMKNSFLKVTLLVSAMALLLTACRKKDAPLPDNLIYFEADAQGMAANENTITIKLQLVRGVTADVPVIIAVTETGVSYGTDYTTSPVLSVTAVPPPNKIQLTVPSGASEVSFTINKKPGVLFDGDEKLEFNIYSSGAPVLIGAIKKLTVSFAEIIASNSSVLVNGGGATYPNKVFIDLSANKQTSAVRTSWDLGFYSGAEYRVTLNPSVNMMVKQINKNDLNTVTVADTVGITHDMSFSQTAPSPAQLPYIDYPSGDITKTAIAEIAATATNNKVYIVNRGTGIGSPGAARGWRKIRIIRNANGGYTLQHASIEATSFTSVDIPKESSYFFKQVSFETGAVNVEPQKSKWDIAWSYFANVTNFGGGEVPYMFQDVILINRNVEIAKVLTSAKAFDAFTETDIAGQTFKTVQNAYASDWRAGGGPGSTPSVNTDRYYIIKDADGNYYKLRFTALTNNGERGYPAFQAVLLKAG